MIFKQDTKVLIGIEPIDFRAGLNKLGAVAEQLFEQDPRKGTILFVFRNRKATDIKFIGYHVNGFFLGHKRLSKGKLGWWPRSPEEAASLDMKRLEKLLVGVDPRGDFHPDLPKEFQGTVDAEDVKREKRRTGSFQRRADQPYRPYPQ